MFKNKMIAVILAASVCGVSALATAQDRPEDVGVAASVYRTWPDARVTMMAFGKGVARISRIRVATSGGTFEERATDFLSRHAYTMDLDPHTLHAVRTDAAAGRTVVSFRQTHGAMQVIDRSLTVTMNDEGEVIRVHSDLRRLEDVLQGPLEAEAASAIATGALWGDAPFAALDASRVVVSLEDGRAIVAWAVHVPLRTFVDHMVVLVDSRDGQIIEVRNRTILN